MRKIANCFIFVTIKKQSMLNFAASTDIGIID